MAGGGCKNLSFGRRLHNLLKSSELTFMMEAHDAISAAIVTEGGFPAIWASGLTISSSLGYRDANEASWSQVADSVERIAETSKLPVLVDGDVGLGNFNNARIFSRKLYDRGAAGICIEDKCFPKLNSFVGDKHPLADTEEFCGRLRAIRDYIPDDFVLIARVEALIAGYSMDSALERAYEYANAGAHGVLIHSRKSSADEIFEFSSKWDKKTPLLVVPTKYYKTPAYLLREAGVSAVIWANHNMRAAVKAMRNVCSQIRETESIMPIEDKVADLDDIFCLLDYQELEKAKAKYVP